MRLKAVDTFLYALVLMLLSTSFYSKANSLKASLAVIPIHSEYIDSEPNGKFVDVAYLIAEELRISRFEVNLFPFARSIDNVVKHKAHFHLPLIRPVNYSESTLRFYYVEEPITRVTFVLYAPKEFGPIEKSELSNFRFDTLRGHKKLFPFTVGEANSIEAGISKVLKGRSNGFIFEQEAVDAYLKEHGIKNIHRQYFQSYDSSIIVPKSELGLKLAKQISNALISLKQRNELQPLTKKIHKPFDDWQPYLAK